MSYKAFFESLSRLLQALPSHLGKPGVYPSVVTVLALALGLVASLVALVALLTGIL